MLREGVRLGPWHRRVFYGSAAALFVTGVLWLVFHYALTTEGEFGATANPLERWWLQIHGAVAMVFLMVLGSLVRGHIRLGWKVGKSRISGGTVMAVNLVLILTGWFLYYAGNDSLRLQVSWIHSAFGLAAPVLVLAHVILGRRFTYVKAAREHQRELVGALWSAVYATLDICRGVESPAVGAPHRGPDPVQLQPANRVRAGRQQR